MENSEKKSILLRLKIENLYEIDRLFSKFVKNGAIKPVLLVLLFLLIGIPTNEIIGKLVIFGIPTLIYSYNVVTKLGKIVSLRKELKEIDENLYTIELEEALSKSSVLSNTIKKDNDLSDDYDLAFKIFNRYKDYMFHLKKINKLDEFLNNTNYNEMVIFYLKDFINESSIEKEEEKQNKKTRD